MESGQSAVFSGQWGGIKIRAKGVILWGDSSLTLQEKSKKYEK